MDIETPPPIQTPSSPTTPTAANTILGKYKLGRLLGRGSFAKVYLAQSITDSNTSVAVKIIDKTKAVNAAMESWIVREVSAMRRLHHHPNILKIYEVMATKTKIYLVMELAQGGELFTKIARRGRLTEAAARRYFQQLVSALYFCHQNGVAHRDMKPQNLLLDHEGNLKVSDFGLSALPEQLQNGLLHTTCGTPAYTAPEIISRRGGYDGGKADAWSCGVILYVFLAGFMPFDDSNLATMYKKIHRREYQFPAWISRPARSVIAQLLDPNPKTRLSIEAVMNLNWFKKSMQSNPPQCSMFQSNILRSKSCNSFDSIAGAKTEVMNAFDIISMSSGLDLSGLFEVANMKEKRFTSAASMEAIEERVREVGGRLGYGVEKGKIGCIGLVKGRIVLLVEVLEVTQSLLLVEVKVIDGGGVDFEEVHWGDLKIGLDDLVLSWHNEVI